MGGGVQEGNKQQVIWGTPLPFPQLGETSRVTSSRTGLEYMLHSDPKAAGPSDASWPATPTFPKEVGPSPTVHLLLCYPPCAQVPTYTHCVQHVPAMSTHTHHPR